MSSLELTSQGPKLISPQELVSLLGNAGPVRNIRVRIHFQSGSTAEGAVRWHDDRVMGPAIIIFKKDNPTQEDGIIPLGGEIFFDQPPKVSSVNMVRTTAIPFWEVSAHQVPIHPMASGLSFEVIN